MTQGDYLSNSHYFVPGEVLALLTPIQELEPGLYMLHTMMEEWVVLRWLIDDEEREQIVVTERESTLPAILLELFTPVGLRLAASEKKHAFH